MRAYNRLDLEITVSSYNAHVTSPINLLLMQSKIASSRAKRERQGWQRL
jgi:hypothetical protein